MASDSEFLQPIEPTGPDATDYVREYAFDDLAAMERRLANQLEQGGDPVELREDLLASGRAPADVDEAFAHAEAIVEERRRANRSWKDPRFWFRVVVMLSILITLAYVLHAIVSVR